jgi:hypothetical protein
MIVVMPTSEASSSQTSKGNMILLAITVALLVAAGYYGFAWVRGLMMLGYVDSAIARVRALSTAESEFAKAHPTEGYTCDLTQLPGGQQIQRLIAQNRTDNGYAFDIVGCQPSGASGPNAKYFITAGPLSSGRPAFCTDQSGVLKSDYSGSVDKCRTSGTTF